MARGFNPGEARDPHGRWIHDKIASLGQGKRVGIQGHVIDNIPSKGYRVRLKGQGSQHYQSASEAAKAVISGRHGTSSREESTVRGVLGQQASPSGGERPYRHTSEERLSEMSGRGSREAAAETGRRRGQNGGERTLGPNYGHVTERGVSPANPTYNPSLSDKELDAAIKRAQAINSPMLSMLQKVKETRQRQNVISRLGPQMRRRQ